MLTLKAHNCKTTTARKGNILDKVEDIVLPELVETVIMNYIWWHSVGGLMKVRIISCFALVKGHACCLHYKVVGTVQSKAC